MGWFERIFGTLTGEVPSKPSNDTVQQAAANTSLPPERIGIAGEYDESGLAKRVVLAFDEDPELDDIGSLWVAQKGGTVILKGKVPSPGFLEKAVNIAQFQPGAVSVDTSQVTIG
ncbi:MULTISPECIES: BON domain-containing protein [Planktothrix]|uniref:BON domain-containing protein n=1 Tax=Planktothrix mougeotii LEGE 06226 TaxID=1828728 RepID=A0ABR9UIW4_9CYAN|nr:MULTISPECIES: BON domain-containing protein [Planktothrix]MBD2482849.1 BON domain-containing protein [Planktothrix sp. FACHB-1365]MBE9146391.1 BON domain-containing protein [Planktothrix mougeotii LEGE 06226]